MRLGFHYHIPAIYRDNSIYMPGYLGVFIDSLASFCENIICFMYEPLSDEVKNLGYKINSPNVHLVNIGSHVSVPMRLINSHDVRKKILTWENKLDVLLIRTPTPLMHIFTKKFSIPIALFIVGDNLAGVDQLPQPMWRKEIIRLLWKWNLEHQRKMYKNSLVFAAGESTYRNLRPIVEKLAKIKTTTLSTKNIYNRNDTCKDDTITLLFVGRFDRSKGLFELYEALSRLKNSDRSYNLYLVGWPGKGDTIIEELDAYAEKLGIKQMITNLGYKQLGEELFEVYRRADIYVMPTKFDEFGRTIWEAMAHSLPVISTKVGSIPIQLTDGLNAILVEPGDSKALSDAIIEISHNKKLRKNLIKEGRELASQNTLEIQSKIIITTLERFIRELNE
ncbi:MAG: glycosyltransferase [Bacteroidetes bacterium]|nr:glycosyltransferase [Bacteroidota bacterium]